MRRDMAKVIVERPRFGSRFHGKPKGYRRAVQRLAEDGGPIREGMKRRCRGGSKILSEHLGPLRRYLDKQVGRPWNKVFSEICAHISRSSAVQDHVRDHVEEYVTTCVILIDGVACNGEGGRLYGKPLHQLPSRYRPWYVCPRTGLLRRVKVPARKRSPEPKPESPPSYIPVSETLQCRFLDNAWYLVTLKPLPLPYFNGERCTAVDVLLNVPALRLTSVEARQHYGAEVYAVGLRRLSRREVRRYPIPVRWWG
jgi:hypothetical protein